MPVTITLEDDEALVLFDALKSGRLISDDPPERNSLWALESLLERELVAPLGPTYTGLLEAARASIVKRGGK